MYSIEVQTEIMKEFGNNSSLFIKENNPIFVFGSNLAGRHGAGAALFARTHFGATYGVGVGRTGSCYALPTKDKQLKTLPLNEIENHVKKFINYAVNNKQLMFFITTIGCGLAGYNAREIAPFFKDIPNNCILSHRLESASYAIF